ncbi:hypothetical protein JAAARDRAFT_41838 [Jaapia argillacea MUCL 33604]|uniref:2'-phosphotransferase n=1 Tax=Jaapia argillacea MUCL 33604 TaxID=933084 RepID=A0A067P7I1_9AGAM|nr:hypothetical protein JAAARDRAFT_41838 [Jaapia argillacea MUCL 33604]
MKPSSTEKASALRGQLRDSPEVRISKTLSWVLRHGAKSQGLAMRPDGYVRVAELLALPKLRTLDFPNLERIVQYNDKKRYNLVHESDPMNPFAEPVWWIRANQGHSMKNVELECPPIKSVSDIPTGVAVHGTNIKAWESISQKGLSKMKRNHIHLAQGVPGSGVISGMRKSSQILIYINVQKALAAGYEFSISDNGVVLTPGNKHGFLPPEFFSRVEKVQGEMRIPLPGWEGESGPVPPLAEVEWEPELLKTTESEGPCVEDDTSSEDQPVGGQNSASATKEGGVETSDDGVALAKDGEKLSL